MPKSSLQQVMPNTLICAHIYLQRGGQSFFHTDVSGLLLIHPLDCWDFQVFLRGWQASQCFLTECRDNGRRGWLCLPVPEKL